MSELKALSERLDRQDKATEAARVKKDQAVARKTITQQASYRASAGGSPQRVSTTGSRSTRSVSIDGSSLSGDDLQEV